MSQHRLDELLQRTSRTFALSIPLLPGETREAVAVAYLLFRIADTFEDSTGWPVALRLGALKAFCGLLRAPDLAHARRLGAQWLAARPCENTGYLELLGATGDIIGALLALPEGHRATVERHAIRTAEGMAAFVARQGEVIKVSSLSELKGYCYVVAGIVGELLTELFELADPTLRTEPFANELKSRAASFGEGLQLVNILKDAREAALEKRWFLPSGVERAELLALAREDLAVAREYVHTLERARTERGFVAFTALPLLLADEALDVLEARGVGAKVSRMRVMEIAQGLTARLAAGASALV